MDVRSWKRLVLAGAVVTAVAVPVLLTTLPLVLPSDRVLLGAALALTVGAAVSAASIGILFLPTVLLAWLAVSANRRGPGWREGGTGRVTPASPKRRGSYARGSANGSAAEAWPVAAAATGWSSAP